ncbi:MAG: hypothetical protein NZ737_00890 [Candidatus Poseidoniaceae archaeon]|nr:hypothetical protein [Candidatus Poseidoniaceae archaeon]
MAQGVGHDDLILSHYDEFNLSNLKFALIGLGIILVGVITIDSLIGNEVVEAEFDAVLVAAPIIVIGIILIIYWFRLTGIRKSAMLAEAEGNYEEAISLVKKLKDYKVIPPLTQKRNASPQPVQTPQLQQQYAQPQPQPQNVPLPKPQPQPQPQPQPATASSPQTSLNPIINVNIQNVQPDTGAKNIHIQDSVVNDSDLL